MADNDWTRQVAMNEPIFETFLAHGEDLSDERHVIHYFYDGDVEGLTAALAADGYEVRPTSTSPGVIAERYDVTDRNWSTATMQRLCALANQFGAEYDGWEGSMVRQGPPPESEEPGGLLGKLFGKKH